MIRSARRTASSIPLRALVAGLALAAALVAVALPAAAQQAPPDPLFRDFEPTGGYEIVVGGKTLESAEIYQSEGARAILVKSSELGAPFLLNLRNRKVEEVGIMSLAKRPDGSIDILADASIRAVADFTADSEGISFQRAGKSVRLGVRASLTGKRNAGDLTAYDAAYARGAEAYEPNASLLSQLKGEKRTVRVEVFFNSKCSVCKQMVPRILKVDRMLAGSSIDFSYYGVPDSYEDPLMEKRNVHAVPTGIVYVDGKEVGRITGGDWRLPEMAIKNVLKSS